MIFQEYAKDVETALRGISTESVEKMIDLLRLAKSHNSNVYLFGNGGSASTASHFANDLLKVGKVHAFSLPDMVSAMTAFGNDNKWENMFADMLKHLLLPQDVVIGISCSGFSLNVVNAILLAKEIKLPGVRTIALTGNTWESPLTDVKPDVVVHVPFNDIRVQEDCHLVISHAVSGAL